MIDTRLDYQSFLDAKVQQGAEHGFAMLSQPEFLYGFQSALVDWATRKGRAAIFADCGLGKTPMQLAWAENVATQTDGRVLILAPLAVAQQTIRESKGFKIAAEYSRSDLPESSIVVTNYEMLDAFNPADFSGVVLDESSILKAYDGKTRTKLIDTFHRTPYRLCCTATPAPNDIAEIANHAEFLGIKTRAEMLAEFFVHDDDGWRLKGHAAKAFYQWLATWSMWVQKPSDIGFDDTGYDLPPRHIMPEFIDANSLELARAQGQLFPIGLQGVTGRQKVRRATLPDKVKRAAELINDSDEQWIVWCGLNDEGRELASKIPDAALVEGSQSPQVKTDALVGFLDGKHRVLITKPSIAGFGLNLQQCHNMLFLGMSDSYESFYQAVRRCWRFGQYKPVNVHIVLAELERPIWSNVQRKETEAMQIVRETVVSMTEFEQAELGYQTNGKTEYREDAVVTDQYTMMLGDCVDRLREVPTESIGFSVFSPPFLSLYTYSDSDRDMGNSRTEDEFFGHYQYLIEELHRVMQPGRIVACHVAQVAAQLAKDGFIGMREFRGRVIDAMTDGGFHYYGDITIDKNPQAQAIRTHAKGLLFAQLKKDASWLRPGLADYLLIFRKPGDNLVPIHPDISNEDWIQWAHPVWYDIKESDTLNVREGRENADDRHICPLQLGLINRAIRLWSNPGETVLSPFAGIGSEGHEAIKLGRRFVGIELKESYYNTAVKNLQRAESEINQARLL